MRQSPKHIHQYPDIEALGARDRSISYFPVLGRERAAALVDDTYIGVSSTSLVSDVEGPASKLFHGRSRIYHSFVT